MNIYNLVSYKTSKIFTEAYSTSFSLASKLFDKNIRQDIYAVYGFVRLADEIVDSNLAIDKLKQLNGFHADILSGIELNYSTNPVIHAFSLTVNKYQFDLSWIEAFFDSMRVDIKPIKFNQVQYDKYIYGSAQVVGLMCLKIFSQNNHQFTGLKEGAMALGSVYQKINFIRDLAADYKDLGRYYFPVGSFNSFDDEIKKTIEKDISAELTLAAKYINRLPINSKKAVKLSYYYYLAVFHKIQTKQASDIKQNRYSISNFRKLNLLIKVKLYN